jgi:hypothetical protein
LAIRKSYPQTSQNRPLAGDAHCGQRPPAGVAGVSVGVADPLEPGVAFGTEDARDAAPPMDAPHSSQ